MPDALPLFTLTRTGESIKPGIQRLYGKRFRVTRSIDTMQGASLPPELFIDYGEPDKGNATGHPSLADLCLMEVGTAAGADETKKRLVMVFETLTDTLVDEVAPVVDYELNGLKRTTHKLIALPDIDLSDYDFEVGTSLYPADGESVLAKFSDADSSDAATRVTLVYLQPGIVTKSKSGGPESLPGTIRHTWTTWHLVPTMPGIITDEDEENVEGFRMRRYTSLSNAAGSAPTGTLTTYPVNIEITRPGTVQIAVDGAVAGEQTPYLVQASPTSGIVSANLSVELVTTATAPAPVAFNLDNIAVSVVARTRTKGYIGTEVGESITVSVYSERIQIEHTVLRAYTIASATGSGIEYRYTYNSAIDADGDDVIGETYKSHIYRTFTLTGSGEAPPTTGVWRREVEPAFTALDGTKYSRVVTWTIPEP